MDRKGSWNTGGRETSARRWGDNVFRGRPIYSLSHQHVVIEKTERSDFFFPVSVYEFASFGRVASMSLRPEYRYALQTGTAAGHDGGSRGVNTGQKKVPGKFRSDSYTSPRSVAINMKFTAKHCMCATYLALSGAIVPVRASINTHP